MGAPPERGGKSPVEIRRRQSLETGASARQCGACLMSARHGLGARWEGRPLITAR